MKSDTVKREIAIRIVIFSSVYAAVAVAVMFLLELAAWMILPVLFVIVLWDAYVYRMNVRVLGMPSQFMTIEGEEGLTLTEICEEGKIKVRGEIWNARSSKKIEKGKKVKVVKREGLFLEVEPLED